MDFAAHPYLCRDLLRGLQTLQDSGQRLHLAHRGVGVFILGFLLLAMNYNHPYTKEARFFYFTTPIVPTVSGRVVEVVAQPGEHLKAGDVMFRIEDTTYRNAVAQKRAALADSEQVVLQLKAALESAQKRVGVALAERNAAQDAFQRGEKLAKGGVIAQSEAVIPEGQLQPSGTLISPESIKAEGRVMVRVKFEEDVSRFHIVPGSTGDVAIYSHHMHHLGVMRKVLLRMKSWMNYVFSDGH